MTIPGLSGSLLSHEAVAANPALHAPDDESQCAAVRRRLLAWHASVASDMGPACSARAVFDRVAAPLAVALGFQVRLNGHGNSEVLCATLRAQDAESAMVLVTAWGRDPAGTWREGVRLGIGSNLRWCFCMNGTVVRVMDARRTYSRRFVEFNLADTIGDSSSFSTFWRLMSAGAFPCGRASLLERAVEISEEHRANVRASLQHGVRDALTSLAGAFAATRKRRPPPAGVLFEESLVVIYRILFLLFAEARGLVPKWHPTYRTSYTIEALRGPVEMLQRPRGLWESLQAIARLAHQGCHAGALRVPPFNGRLFSPAHAPLAESAALDDGAVREAMLALTTTASRNGRQRIAYADLGVEQLGGVYERVLDFEPAIASGPRAAVTLVRAGRRKATGAFYTPRSLTEYLVRRTLAPLVLEADPDRILSLRVLDPSMGSGAFLVAACRYLALAYEAALLREGVVTAADLTEHDRSGFRRVVAQRCLFGVDINPMAVQLARLSLWLATLSADRPLTFLDHHLRTGNSLVGASLADVCRHAPSARAARAREARLPLFDLEAADLAIGTTIGTRLSIATDPGDTLEQVKAKERLMASLLQDGAPLARWKAAADLWCASWFHPRPVSQRPSRGAAFRALLDEIVGRGAVLPAHISAPLRGAAKATAERERFFHWTLEFPEVFHDSFGRPLQAPGFDAVIGNPPWEMLRGHRGPGGDGSAHLATFARESGVYSLQGSGHANLFQLFLERAFMLVRRGGRVGMVLPSGLASDHGCASLRRHLLDSSEVDTFVSVENRGGLFPIHRALKFLLVAATSGSRTATLPCRFGVRSPDLLDALPDRGPDELSVPVPRSLFDQMSGSQVAIPELRTKQDLSIASRITFSVPALEDAAGWGVAFGRELNATDDRKHFLGRAVAGACPVLEGKQIQPFVADVAASRFFIPGRIASALLEPGRSYGRSRLAYRDVASPSNRLTLIAAIVPAQVLTTHTLFCMRSDASEEVQQFLCGVFNSYVANYLVRLRVSMHVSASIMARLPVPVPARDSAPFRTIAGLAAALSSAPGDRTAAARLQAAVARLYGLTAPELQHVLDTFPLVDEADRRSAAEAFAKEPQ